MDPRELCGVMLAVNSVGFSSTVIKGVWLLELLEQAQWLVMFWPPSRQWRLINHMPCFSLQREYKLVVSLCCERSEKLNLTCEFKSLQLACSKSQLVHVTWCLKCIMSREIVHCYPLFSGEMGIVALRFWVNLHEINLKNAAVWHSDLHSPSPPFFF